MTAASLVPVDGEGVDPGLAFGVGQPNVPWTVGQPDRIYNMLLAGGQGSGKSSLLLRACLNDIYAANTATVVVDMKGSLSERLLRLHPPEVGKRWYDHDSGQWEHGTKRLWYLDLGRPAFGLTLLRVERGWTRDGLADEFSRIADAMCRSLLDLYPGQIMGSSEDLIERAVVGTMAIAWHEHTQRCAGDGTDPTSEGFSGSFEILAQMFSPTDRLDDDETQSRGRRRARPNRWHQAAGRACQRIPNLDQVADTLLYDIPRQARDNLGDIAKRMEAPANKIRPLVGAAASVRRFVGHPERLSMREVIERNDTLIVNPRIELIGEDQAAILTNFIVHMLDLQLKRQLAHPASTRHRVSLIIDEAQRLITDTLIRMVESHREAGLTTAAALQYVSQLGAYEPTAARREKIIKGVGNLLQSKVLFRMSDSEDADRHTQIFRSVYETMVRADPTSRSRMPFDPARMQTLRDHNALVSVVSAASPNNSSGLVDARQGATRLPAFVTQTYPMPAIEEIPDTWADIHLARQRERFPRYPNDMTPFGVDDVPAGLSGSSPPGGGNNSNGREQTQADARTVAREAVGHTPEGALRKTTPPPPTAAPTENGGDAPEPAYDPAFFSAGRTTTEKPGTPKATPEPAPGSADDQSPAQQGSARATANRGSRSDAPDPGPPAHAVEPPGQLVADSPVLAHACHPTERPLPSGELKPASEAGQQALRAAAALESIASLGEWQLAGSEALEAAGKEAQAVKEQALAELLAEGKDHADSERLADRRARHARARALEPHADAAWRTPAKDLALNDGDAHILEVIARLQLAAPRLLIDLTEGAGKSRVMHDRLARLHDAGLIARSNVGVSGRRGRPPTLHAVAPRGLEYLRGRRSQLAPDQELPRYLDTDRKLPTPGKGSEVPHELAIQVALVALGQYGGNQVQLHWHTTRMPGGRWDVGMIHRDRRDRTLTLTDLLPGPGYTVHGEQLDAPSVLEPDVSVQLQGPQQDGRVMIDLLVEVDRTGRGAYNAKKYAAYDQFLGGWCMRTRRFGRERGTRPVVVFIARQPDAMLSLLQAADHAMTLGFGARGQYEADQFEYPGRAHTVFTNIQWLLGGQAFGLRLPALPPQVRGSETELRPERVALLPKAWWPRARR